MSKFTKRFYVREMTGFDAGVATKMHGILGEYDTLEEARAAVRAYGNTGDQSQYSYAEIVDLANEHAMIRYANGILSSPRPIKVVCPGDNVLFTGSVEECKAFAKTVPWNID